jgi:putative endonuclease
MGFKRSRVQIPPARSRNYLTTVFYVYVLRSSKTNRRYIGSCKDVNERLRRHNFGHSKFTRHGVPWTLVHTESFSNRADATRKERYYKSGRGRDELDRLEL